MAEKTEQPTRKRLQDAAQKGQSFKTRDLIVACLTLSGVAYLDSFGSLLEFMGVFRQIIANGFQQEMQGYAHNVVWIGLKLLLPVFLVCIAASALPSLLQSGFVLASEALKFNLEALNPVNGFKKLFSLRTVKEAVKSVLYLLCVAVAGVVLWHQHKGLLFAQIHGTPFAIATIWRKLLLDLVLTCLGCILVVMLLDALAEYFLFMKDQKMEKEEVKRETKEQEGNPEIKSRRRETHMEILSEQIKSDVANSRMIIANPTHIAIGIYFKPELVPMPFVSVRETNQRALAVRAYAEKIGIAVVRDVALARRIFHSHSRYSFVNMAEMDGVLRLLAWLEQVEATITGAPTTAVEEDEPRDSTTDDVKPTTLP